MSGSDPKYVGVMVSQTEVGRHVTENKFYAELCALGPKFGLDVYVFSPLFVNAFAKTVPGFIYIPERLCWERRTFPLPDLIYDRSFFAKRSDFERHRMALVRMARLKPVSCLGCGLKSKWDVLQSLRCDPLLRPFLPQTGKLLDSTTLIKWLAKWGRVFIKPQGGSQGKGTAAIIRLAGEGYLVRARDLRNQPVEQQFSGTEQLTAWVREWCGTRRFLIQPYLSLRTSAGVAFDIRALVQKNGHGLWELTGMAVRKGRAGSITSNLHGGGSAYELQPFLAGQFGREQGERIAAELRVLAKRIPPVLERFNGRLAELGLDFGVDQEGHVWIIEANSKPGRKAFFTLDRGTAYRKAIEQPIAYARYVLHRVRPSFRPDREIVHEDVLHSPVGPPLSG